MVCCPAVGHGDDFPVGGRVQIDSRHSPKRRGGAGRDDGKEGRKEGRMLRGPGYGLVVRAGHRAAVILASVRRGGTRGLKIWRSEVEATVEHVVLPMGRGGDFQFFWAQVGEFDRDRLVGWLVVHLEGFGIRAVWSRRDDFPFADEDGLVGGCLITIVPCFGRGSVETWKI